MLLNRGSTNLHIRRGLFKFREHNERPKVLLLFRDGMETPRSFSHSRKKQKMPCVELNTPFIAIHYLGHIKQRLVNSQFKQRTCPVSITKNGFQFGVLKIEKRRKKSKGFNNSRLPAVHYRRSLTASIEKCSICKLTLSLPLGVQRVTSPYNMNTLSSKLKLIR